MLTQKNSSMKNHLFIFFLVLMYSCTDNGQRQNHDKEISAEGNKFNGYYVNDKKSGEYIRYEKGRVVQRDYYVDDSICLSIFYSKDSEKPMYAQFFEHNEIDRQIVFNSKEFNNYFFSLQKGDILDEEKGKKMFQYYCTSCHSSASRDASLKKVKDGTRQLYDLINSESHPISFQRMDSIELHYLLSYIKSW